MSTTITRQKAWGLKKEAVRGTAETTADTWIPYTELEITIENEYAEDNSAFGRREEIRNRELAFVGYKGSFEGVLSTDQMGVFLFYLFGTDTATTNSGATTHIFSTSQLVGLPTFTCFNQWETTSWYAISGCVMDKLEIEIGGQQEFVKFKGEFMGRDRVSASSQTPSFTDTTRYLLGKHAVCGYANDIAGLATPTYFDTQSCKITIENNTTQEKALGSVNAIDIIATKFNVSAEFSLIAKTTFWGTATETGNKKAFVVDMINTNASNIGSSTQKPALKIEIPTSVFQVTHKRPLDERVEADIQIMAEYDYTNSFIIRPTLINGTSSY